MSLKRKLHRKFHKRHLEEERERKKLEEEKRDLEDFFDDEDKMSPTDTSFLFNRGNLHQAM